MLRMIDRHAVQAVLDSGKSSEEVAKQFGISQRMVQRIVRRGSSRPRMTKWSRGDLNP